MLGSALLVCTALLLPSVQAGPEKAHSADSFVDSIGVATHLRYVDTAYGNYEGIIKPRLQELGVRHIRDGGSESTSQQKLNDLATIGIKSTLVMDPRDRIYPSNVVNDAIKPVLASIEAVEGPNEWDVQPSLKYNNETFPQGLRNYQHDLYAAVKSNRVTASLPVLMPSMAFPSNSIKLGFLSSLDMGNMHSYAGGNQPDRDLDIKYIPSTRLVAGLNKPIVATECGWHNATNDKGASQPGVSEKASGKYVPRLYLEYFNRGIERTFIYELSNERQAGDQEQNFGLLRYDGSPKPAFIALKNLIFLLKNPGPSFPLKSLDYSLSGNTTNVHHTLLQKRNGTFYLILWLEVPSFNLQNKTDIRVPEQQVTLNLNTPIRNAATYQPINSTIPTRQQYTRIKQLSLSVPDHPLVIQLVPAI